MTKMNQYNPQNNAQPSWYEPDCLSSAMDRWANIHAVPQNKSGVVIDIYDVIGEDFFWGDGFSEKKLAGILRTADGEDVTVNINSPGGNMFDGLAIYNRLMAYEGKVTVNVVGIAASAASVIAMAGEVRNMNEGSLMMIHNAWGAVVGDKHDFLKANEVFAVFDSNLGDVYAERSGLDKTDIMAMMDEETFMDSATCIEKGFATQQGEIETVDMGAMNRLPEDILAKRKVEASLSKAGHTRKEIRALMNKASKRDAAGSGTREAADETSSKEIISLLENATKLLKG